MRIEKRSYGILVLALMSGLLMGCNPTQKVEKEEVAVSEEERNYALPRAGEAAIESLEKEENPAAVDGRQQNKDEKSDTKSSVELRGEISVATVGSPNTEILHQAARILEKEGYQLNITVCEDYLTPNRLVEEGTVDCNYYQHALFLDRYNVEYQTNLLEAAKIHYEPMAIFGEKLESLEQVEKGMKVALPKNTTALAQALLLLQQEGLLALVSDADMTADMEDIVENPLSLEFEIMEEEKIAAKMDEVDLGIFHTGYSLKEGIHITENLLAVEQKDSTAAKNLAQSIVVSEYPNEKAALLIEALKSEEMQEYITNQYHGSIYVMGDVGETQEVLETNETQNVGENG